MAFKCPKCGKKSLDMVQLVVSEEKKDDAAVLEGTIQNEVTEIHQEIKEVKFDHCKLCFI